MKLIVNPILTVCLLFFTTIVFAQQAMPLSEKLKGLILLSSEEMQSKQMKIDGKKIPVYLEDGSRTEGKAMFTLLSTGTNTLDAYADGQKEIKAYVLRPITEVETQKYAHLLMGDKLK